jgi:hypothetical protein
MSEMAKVFTVCYIILFFCLGSPPAFSGNREIDLELRGQAMSAELQGISLRLILEKLNREKGIWSKGDESVLEEKVSVRVMDLPLLDGLRRILSDFNHVLVFDRDKRLVGLFILGKKDPGKRSPRDVGVVTGKSPPSQPVEEATVSRDPFEVFPGADHTGNVKTRSTDRTIGKDPSPLADRDTQIGDKPLTHRSSVPESPFGENAAASPENPFTKSIFPPTENPFEDNIFPGSEGPFSDPF